MNIPVRLRLTLWYLTLFAVIVGAWSVFVVALVTHDLYQNIDSALDVRAAQIAGGFEGRTGADLSEVAESTLAGAARVEANTQLIAADGHVLAATGDPSAKRSIAATSVLERVVSTGRGQFQTVKYGEDTLRVLVTKVPNSDRLLLVGVQTEATDAAVARITEVMLISGPLALLAAGLVGWLLAGRALRPVARMTETAAGIGIDRLDERVPVPVPNDEFRALAVTLNSMLGRLEEGVNDKRRLVADASHELQTPLAVMRAELDVSLASSDLSPDAVEVLESVREEADRMARIVRNLLALARFDEGTLRVLRQPVELHGLAVETCDAMRTLAREKGVSVTVAGPEVTVEADPEYIRMVVVNLLENAIKYSGGGSGVSVTTDTLGSKAVLSVSDTGPGISEEAREHIFDRFYRADDSRTRSSGGSGLGLAITREIVEAHGGTIEVDSELGRGSTFTVTLPGVCRADGRNDTSP
jgi:heavy metal sensor kinase